MLAGTAAGWDLDGRIPALLRHYRRLAFARLCDDLPGTEPVLHDARPEICNAQAARQPGRYIPTVSAGRAHRQALESKRTYRAQIPLPGEGIFVPCGAFRLPRPHGATPEPPYRWPACVAAALLRHPERDRQNSATAGNLLLSSLRRTAQASVTPVFLGGEGGIRSHEALANPPGSKLATLHQSIKSRARDAEAVSAWWERIQLLLRVRVHVCWSHDISLRCATPSGASWKGT